MHRGDGLVGLVAGRNAEPRLFSQDQVAVVVVSVAQDDRLRHDSRRAESIRGGQQVGRAFRAQTVRHGHAIGTQRRFLERGELVDDGIRGEAVHRAEQAVAIERVGDDRLHAERPQAGSAGRVADQPDDAMAAGDQQTSQIRTELRYTPHMPAGARTEAELRTVERYDALIRVSQALRSYHDRDTLFRCLARELRPVVEFSFLSVGLYDERTHTVESTVLEASGAPIPPPRLSADESLTYFVIRQQKPLLIPDVQLETRFPEATAYLRQQDMRSTCSLPLTTRQRRIGMLLAASTAPDAYESEDVAFLSLVANQVALAIDDAMNYGELQDALALERERQRNLDASDELLRALSTVLDIRQVFQRVSSIAATVVPHDLLTFTFHDRGEVALQAASAEWEPLPTRLKLAPAADLDEGYAIVNDLNPEKCPVWSRPNSGSACTRRGIDPVSTSG